MEPLSTPSVVLPPTKRVKRSRDSLSRVEKKQVKAIIAKEMTKADPAVYTSLLALNVSPSNEGGTVGWTRLLYFEDKSRFSTLTQTAGYGNRTGNELLIRSLMLRGEINHTGVNTNTMYRLVVIYTNDGAIPRNVDIMDMYSQDGSTAFDAHHIEFFRGLKDTSSVDMATTYRVVIDKLFYLGAGQSTQSDPSDGGIKPYTSFKLKVKIPKKGHKLTYKGATATTDAQKGHFWVKLFKNSTLTNGQTAQLIVKCNYTL